MPRTGVTIGADGALYGATLHPGSGAVYRLVPPSRDGRRWKLEVLHLFTAAQNTNQDLTFGGASVVYGISEAGGPSPEAGWAFSLKQPSNGSLPWKYQRLTTFIRADMGYPSSPLLLDGTGALFGTTRSPGTALGGTVYRLKPAKNNVWRHKTLFTFSAAASSPGYNPSGSLAMDGEGTLYGAAYTGGTTDICGAMYKLKSDAKPSDPSAFSWIYDFSVALGCLPRQAVFDSNGTLYTSAEGGGTNSDGALVRLRPPQSGSAPWTVANSYAYSLPDDPGFAPKTTITVAGRTAFGKTSKYSEQSLMPLMIWSYVPESVIEP